MVKVGDLVRICPARTPFVGNIDIDPQGVIFSQIDEDWFRVYVTWKNNARMTDFPRWMLQKID
jgi:hypothetical protein